MTWVPEPSLTATPPQAGARPFLWVRLPLPGAQAPVLVVNECVSPMAHADRWKRVEMESLVDVAGARPLAHQSCFALITFSKKQNPRLADPGTIIQGLPEQGRVLVPALVC